MITFTPANWSQVQAYDTVVFNVEVNPANKPRLRRMVLTSAPYVFTDAHSVEHGQASLTGQHVTKSGARNKAYRQYSDDSATVRIGLVVSVTRSNASAADEIAKVWDEAHAANEARDAVEDEAAAQDIDDWKDPESNDDAPMFIGASGNLVVPGVTTGDTVQRVGEVGPDRPVGKVLAMAPGGGFKVFLVSFSGLAPLRMKADGLVKVEQPATAAPSLADDLATLRLEIQDGWDANAPAELAHVLARLDRIAAQMTQPSAARVVMRGDRVQARPEIGGPADGDRGTVESATIAVRWDAGGRTSVEGHHLLAAGVEADAPQRATGRHGDLLWRHGCGWVGEGDGDGGAKHPYLCLGANCWSDKPWQPVYTLGSQ